MDGERVNVKADQEGHHHGLNVRDYRYSYSYTSSE